MSDTLPAPPTPRRRTSTGGLLSRLLVLGFAVTACGGADPTPPDAAAEVSEDVVEPLAEPASPATVPIRQAGAEVGRAPEPVRLDYPGIDAQMPVEARGVDGDGEMDIPRDASTAAWYEYGPAPGQDRGSTVIAAHAGSEETPVGPLHGLGDAAPGDVVEVEDDDGEVHSYRVSEVEQIGRRGADLEPYFDRQGPHRLVLFTCGGEWLPEAGRYADNIIVVAEPLR